MYKNTLPKNIIFLLFLALYALILINPLSSNSNIPINEDYYNHLLAIIEAKKALLQGQFPLRVFTSNHHQWLYPNFQFYSSSTYTIAGLIHIMTGENPIIAFKITLLLALIFGGFYMHRFAYVFLQSEHAAILSSISFISAPYILLTINHLGAFNEAVALLTLPAVLYYTFQRYDHPKKITALIGMTFFWYLLVTMHLVTFVLSSFFIGLLLLIITLKNKNYSKLFDTGIAYVFACFLGMWKLAPMILFAKKLVVHNTYASSGVFFFKSPTFYKLVSPIGNIGDGLPTISTDVNTIVAMHPNIGIPMLFAFGFSFIALFKKIKIHSRIDDILLPLVALFLLAFFLSWSPFNFWRFLPESFRFFQYPYRILGQVVWIGSLLVGFFICWLFPKKMRISELALGILLILSFSSYWIFERQMQGIASLQLAKYTDYNTDYLIDATHENTNIDTKTFTQQTSLEKIKPIIIEPHPWTSFFIIFEAKIPKNDSNNSLGLFVNGALVKTLPLRSGIIFWSEEISPYNKIETITYHIIDPNKKIIPKPPVDIFVKSIQLRGFMNHQEVMSVTEVKPNCFPQKNTVDCHLNPSPHIKIIELPVYYFPEMIEIFNNGKKVNFHSIYYKNYLLASIQAESGNNDIHIIFRGLPWANYLSLLFWVIWFGILIFVIIDRLRHQ